MIERKVVVNGVKTCCQKPENLRVVESVAMKTVRVCDVCGCKHIELVAESFDIGTKFASVGAR